VFLHMGKSFVERAVAEIARTLKPGGAFVFDVSFPNARNPQNLLPRLKPKRFRAPNYMKYWRRTEFERLLERTGLAAKAGGVVVLPVAHGLLPKRVGRVPIPLARRVNDAVERAAPAALDGVLASSFVAHSRGLLP
jgi:SAM-dependent methyltransferase